MSIGPQHNGGILGATNNPTSTSAGGIWTPVQHYQAQRDGLWPVTTAPLPDYTISRSLRFNSADSAYLSWTPSIAGNRRTWTWSGWLKRSQLSNDYQRIVSARGAAGELTEIVFNNETATKDCLVVEHYAGGVQSRLVTTAVFRDPSAWYHIVLAYDTTQTTSSDRVKLYVNSVLQTFQSGSYPAQNVETYINSTYEHRIGRGTAYAINFDGYLADVRLIDGQQLTPSSFGETDLTTGVWKPKAYSGSYGTNGFYLPFTDNSTQNNLGVNTAQVGDELRNYTVLHLSGNPANTSGYNCFSDRSSNNHLLTIAGDVRTSARSPFTDTASGSAYFDGSGDYISAASSAQFAFGSSTDFCVELWYYPVGNPNPYPVIWDFNGGWSANVHHLCDRHGNVPTKFTYWVNNYGASALLTSITTVQNNTWYHLVVSRSGSTWRLFVNGTLENTTNWSGTVDGGSSSDFRLGTAPFSGSNDNWIYGNLSNVRIIKNQAVFTGNFTPSSSPLTSTAVGHTGTGAASSITGTVSLLTLVDKVGANNSGFIDESTNNAVITRSGNVTQGSFSPFGTSGWAMYQSDISGNYPSFTTSAGTAFQFTGNFTIEGWVYPIIYSGTGDTSLWVTFDGSTYLALNYDGSGNYNIYLNSGAVTSTFSSGIVANTWNHVAMVRSGSTITLYTNGVSRGTIQNSATLGHANPSLARIGGGVASCSRYVSNLRIIKGTALYTSNFIPSTTPLTAVAGTVLLTCQDNRFVDNSANNFTVTFTGTPQVQPLSPFQPHTSVTKTYSNFFDGTNDYIQSTLPSTITGTFTIDFWWYRPASGVATIFNIGDSMSADSAEVYIGTNGTILKYYNNNNERITTSTLPTLSAWNYLAVTRDSSNVVRLYLNGTQVGGTYVQTGNLSTQLRIGCEYYNGAPAFAVGGYISNFRVSNIVRDVSSLPSTPFVSDANTLALTCQDSTFKDNSSYGSTVTVYDAPRCTEFNPLGRTFTTGVNYSPITHGSSAYFDGSGDYLTVPTNTNIQLSTNDFTIEFWAWLEPYVANSASSYWASIIDIGVGVSDSNSVTGTLGIWQGDGTGTSSVAGEYCVIISGSTANQQRLHSGITGYRQWTHVALTRNSGTFNLWQNGILRQSATLSANINRNDYQVIGKSINSNIKGTISGLRVINGTALYKSNFVPQLQPPQTVANTQLLLNFNNAGVVDYTGKGVLETVGDSRSVTNNKKTLLDATGSIYFDGTNDYLRSSLPASYWNLSGDFTVEFWINPIGNSQSGSVYYDIIGTSNNQSYIGSGQTGWVIAWSAQYGLRFGWQNSNTWSIDQSLHSTTPTFNTWAHIAVVRRGSTITGYINGIAGSTPITSSTNFTSSLYSLHIGSGAGNQNFTVNGYLQDVRITTIARYTGTFTPPVRTFSATVRDVGHKQWVVNNLSVATGAGNDSLVDTPTNYGTDIGLGGEVRGNYCTLNPLWLSSSAPTLTNGNLDTTATNSSWNNAQGTFGISSGKWYWESTMSGDMFFQLGVGLREAINNVYSGSDVNSWTYDGRAFKNGNGSQPAYGATFAGGDIISVALDMDAGTLTFYKNGVSQGVAFSSGLAGKTVFPQFGCYQAGRSQSVNFGQRPFNYTAPSGYKALCTQNLPTPSIVKSNTAFDTALYTGNGTSITVSGLNFSPDLVWMKARSGAFQHGIFDRVRGNGLGLVSNSTAVETSYAAGAFTNDGFTNTTDYNGSGVTYAAWSWDENPVAGVDIALATANASAVVTYNHSLGVSPAFVISKSRSAAVPWLVYHKSLGANQYLLLNTTDAATTLNGVYTASSSQFTITSQTANATYVSYLFAEMPGFSAFGSYTGNGSTDGPFVYTGFRPAWIMIKRSDSVENWNLYDNKRNRYNIADLELYPNLTNSEGTTADRDFLSNGFKIRNTNIGRNASGGTYIYAAFAENPFKYSLAR